MKIRGLLQFSCTLWFLRIFYALHDELAAFLSKAATKFFNALLGHYLQTVND
jgi:hypothetical protein